jgi:hypothetical protein
VIELTRELLVELGLVPKGARPRFNIALTRGASLSTDVWLEDGSFVHVKASELERLESEYRRAREAFERFGEYTVEPLGFLTRDGWDILVTRGVRAQPLDEAHFSSRSAVPQRIAGFFARCAPLARPGQHAHAQLLEDLRGYPGTAAWARDISAALGPRTLAALERLGTLPQHGDFTRNNLAVTDDGLVVFDWEDFGNSQLPGLDLCTLLLSLAQFEAETLRSWLRPQSSQGSHGALVNQACLALGLSADLFRSLVPLYLLAFLKLKAPYSERLRQALIRLIEDLAPDPIVRVA